MRRYSRRAFLQRAAFTGAGVAVLPAAFPHGATGAALPPNVGEPDANFFVGRVISISGSTVLAVDFDGNTQRLVLSRPVMLWKQGKTNALPLAVGDSFYAYGQRHASGVLQVERMWVAIVMAIGSVQSVTEKQITMLPLWGGNTLQAGISPYGTIVHDSTGVHTVTNFEALVDTTYAEVVGYCSSDQSSQIIATRIYTGAATTGAAVSQSAPQSQGITNTLTPDATCLNDTYTMLAAWECCGGINDCGTGSVDGGADKAACKDTGTGACGSSPPCQTNVAGLSWPNVSGHGSYSSTLPVLSCGEVVEVDAVCQGKSLQMPVVDHGPVPKMVSSNLGCRGLRNLSACITACGFVALGGDLGYGHLDVEVIVTVACP